jgi:hypothetical protein
MTYFNTANLKNPALGKAEQRAKNQEDMILDFFVDNPHLKFTPSYVWNHFESQGKQWPITSVRRAITNLTKRGVIEKCITQKTGIYDMPEYEWKLKVEKETLFD